MFLSLFPCNEPCKHRVRFQRVSVLKVESSWFEQTRLYSVQFQPAGILCAVFCSIFHDLKNVLLTVYFFILQIHLGNTCFDTNAKTILLSSA